MAGFLTGMTHGVILGVAFALFYVAYVLKGIEGLLGDTVSTTFYNVLVILLFASGSVWLLFFVHDVVDEGFLRFYSKLLRLPTPGEMVEERLSDLEVKCNQIGGELGRLEVDLGVNKKGKKANA